MMNKYLEIINEIDDLVDGIQDNEKNVESIQELLDELRELLVNQECQTRIIFQNNNCKSVTQKVIAKGEVYIDD